MIAAQQLEFGMPGQLDVFAADAVIAQLAVRERALLLGWAAGCPVALELTDPTNPNPARGPEAMRARYHEVCAWSGQIAQAATPNQALHDRLTAATFRYYDEPVGHYELESVPTDYETVFYPMTTLAGFALPRILIEHVHTGKAGSREHRIKKAKEIVSQAVSQVDTPIELTVEVSERLAHGGGGQYGALKYLLSAGWLAEQGSHRQIAEVQDSLTADTKILRKRYHKMPAHTRDAHGIVG